MASRKKREITFWITVVILGIALVYEAYFLIIKQSDYLREQTKWVYHGVINPNIPEDGSIKDPEFVRYPNNTAFQDEEGFYYIVASIFRTDNAMLTGILKTRDFNSYTCIGYMPLQMKGKIAPYCIYNPEDSKFYLYYSDWENTVNRSTILARLGLAVGTNIRNPATFTDVGYLTIEESPEVLAPHFGWDPYIVNIGNTYYMLISAARYEVHLVKAETLGTAWSYVKTAVTGELENPALFRLDSRWYMLLGIHDGIGYDLYFSEDFLYWKLVKKNWFKDEQYSILPAGSTCIIANGTFYHLYQTLIPNYKDDFQLSLASIKVEDLIAEINK